MKHLFLFPFLVISVCCLFGCSSDDIDVVKDITPVQIWDESTYDLLDSLRRVPDNQKLAFIQEHLPHLTPALCRYVETRFDKARIDSIVYRFGSGRAKGVLDGAGNRHSGYFKEELIAYVYLHGKEQPIKTFVRCLNGMFEIEGGSRLGPVSAEYIIRRDQGLCHHLDFQTSIWLAEKFNLPLYKGKLMRDKYRISPKQARKIDTKKTQVSVLVFNGDKFRLFGNDARYIPARRN